jgi:UDP-4-amino-4,6-dideoxy-N-acetyl-beta-L-altrosamine transaminase
MIPYGRQEITQQDIDAVVDVLHSDFLTQGPQVPRFEEKLAAYCGAAHAVAVNSATSALHLACLALGLGPGDRLWTSPITFVASANCGLYCGASVDFVDIDPESFNLDPQKLQAKLELARAANALPKVVVAVHMCGQPCNMRRIHKLGQEYGFAIIEDASHAIGARYLDEPVGNCRYSDITVFSFHPVKIVTTAEGGLACTNDPALAERMELLRSHGITRDASLLCEPAHGPWYYEQQALGYNYRMTELQAALGNSQFDRLYDYVAARHRLARRYDSLLGALPVCLPARHADGYSAFHLYIVRLQRADPKRVAQVHAAMRAAGVMVNLHYIPVPMQPFYRDLGFKPGDWPVAMDYYQRAITLPLFATMTEEQQDEVVRVLATALLQTEA